MSDTKFGCITAAIIGGFLFVLLTLWSSLATVEAGHVGIMRTWGKVEAVTLSPGFNFKIPFTQDVVHWDTRVQKYQVEASAASKDLQDVKSVIALNWHIDPGNASWVFQNVGIDFADRVLSPAVQEAFKFSTAQFTAEQLIQRREEAKVSARDLLKERLSRYFIVVDELNIVDFDFSASFNAAIEAANTARQNVVEEEQKLRRIQVEVQQRIATADADAKSVRVRAEAEAFANEIVARSVTSALIEWRKANGWNGVLPQIVTGESGMFLNVTPTPTAGKK